MIAFILSAGADLPSHTAGATEPPAVLMAPVRFGHVRLWTSVLVGATHAA